MVSTSTMIVLAVLLIVLLAFCPIISIWAINTLFVGTLLTSEIPLTIWTYLAMLWFSGLIAGVAKGVSSN